MTPDEARKDYPLKDWTPRDQVLYTQGFKDGYEAAQREQIAAAMASLPRTIDAVPHFASETNYGRPGR